MSCPTCSNTMHNLISTSEGKKIFWCPRCGTIKVVCAAYEVSDVPKLVERCRKLELQMSDKDSRLFYHIGISSLINEVSESINLPEHRPEPLKEKHDAAATPLERP